MLRTAEMDEGPISVRLPSYDSGVCEFMRCWSAEMFEFTFMSCLAAGVLNELDDGVMFVLVLTMTFVLFSDALLLPGVESVGLEKDLSLPPNRCRISTASLYVSFVLTWSNNWRFSALNSANCSEFELTFLWNHHATKFLSRKILQNKTQSNYRK